MNNHTPLVSIIVPVYNTSEYLKECLDSIQAQTFEDFEVLLVNDGSTDNSALICKQYQETDTRFRLIDIENAGVASARNKGLSLSQGKYIAFIDSDDIVRRDYLYHLVNNMEEHIQIVQCSFSRFTKQLPPPYTVLKDNA